MMRLFCLSLLLFFCITPARADDAGKSALAPSLVTRVAGRTVAFWLPAAAGAAPHPLVMFSHGFGGCKTQSKFLMAALAAHGYIVAAPDHADAGCGEGHHFGRPDKPFRDAKDWTAETYAGRRDDIINVYDALKADKIWRKRIDWQQVGLAGHSLGGYTVLALAGGWPAWKMPGIKSVLALSPYAAPLSDHGALGDIDIPVMYQGGTRDFGITPDVRRKGGAFDQTPKAVYVEFEKTGHFGWTDLQSGTHENIARYSLWFFDKTLKGIDAPLPEAPGVAALRVNGDAALRGNGNAAAR